MKPIYSTVIKMVFLTIVLLVSSTACNSSTSAKSMHALLDDLVTPDGFVFEQYNWFISKTDFYKKSNLKEDSEQPGNAQIVSDRKDLTFTNPDMKAFPVYYFSDNKLYSGSLVANFQDGKAFLSCSQALKLVLDKSLDVPFQGNTDFLNEMPSVAGDGKSVTWERKDGSRMTVSTFDNTKTQPEYSYFIITIKVNAPNLNLKPNTP